MAKTKAQPDASSKKKKKKSGKSLLSGPAAAAMKAAKPAKPNPFETIWSRRKFDVIGKKRKGEERRVGLARSLAIEKRKKTLLKEYEQSAKSSKFIDRRIGEKDDALQEFDKAVLRLQRERQLKLKRTSKYNLSDGEEEDSMIDQAYPLSERDDFDDQIPPDDDDDAFVVSENSADSSKYLSFRTMPNLSETIPQDGDENAHKTKKQVMSEIIAKSKYYKAQKAKDKEEDEQLAEKLDKDFTSLAQTEALQTLTQPSKINALKALLNKNDTKPPSKEELSASADKESLKKEQPDAYDRLVKEMVLERRAHPSDKTKTPEEIAQEERERLEKLEEERQKRMLATDDSSDEGSDDVEDAYKPALKKFRSVSGDDLGDSFSINNEKAEEKGWIDDIYNMNADNHDGSGTSSEDSEHDEDEGNDDDDDTDSEGSTSGNEFGNLSTTKDWEQSDGDDISVDGEDAKDPDGKRTNITDKISWNISKNDSIDSSKTHADGKLPSVKQEALPFLIGAPTNLMELCSLLDNRSDSEVVEAINRIRVSNSINLAAENRRKMQVFYGVLLQYFAVLATRSPINIKMINSLVKPLIEMGMQTPYFAAICARQRLIHIRTRLCEDLKIPGKSGWPTLKTLLLLRLWSLTFPCSDFRHVVMTPVLLLMCEYLMRCPIESGRDIVIGAFLCSMVLSVTRQSRKFCPEAIIFLQSLLMSCVELESGAQWHSQLAEFKTLKPWLHVQDQECDVHPIDFFTVMDMPADSPFFASDSFRASVLASVAETLRGFIDVYGKLSSFPEIFLPISALLQEVLRKANLPGLLGGNLEGAIDLINKTNEYHMQRQPLQMRKQKPEPIKLLNPKFEEDFVKGRDYDPDRERARLKKLEKQVKKEKKGAIREVRKDNYFLSAVKESERLLDEEERAERYGKAMAFLQEQEHAFKSGQLGKGRKRRK